MRYRYKFLLIGSALAIIASLLTDPDSGLGTALGALGIAQGVWAVAAAHYARKAVADYPEADQQDLFAKAKESPEGAGLALIALAILFYGLLSVFAPRAHASEIPAGYYKYGHILKAEQTRLWPGHPDPATLAALVEQESCISIKHSRCWSPSARLKSDREEGAGLGQITRAYRADGSVRFDSLAGLVAQYPVELRGWTWANVYDRPDLQIRAIVLMSRDAAKPFDGLPGHLHFGDAAYNGGLSGVQKERKACHLTKGCDPGQWFGHVEHHCLKSRAALYGGRSACDINREHVRNVFLVRAQKYREVWA